MHSILNSLRKRLYTMRLSSASCAKEWHGEYYSVQGDTREVACAFCRKLKSKGPACAVPFGSPLRKCVTASQEAHLHSLTGMSLLEIGVGKHSIPRRLVTTAGGTWTGIDPLIDANVRPVLGTACHGSVGDIPFPSETFDIVAGIQTLEHWSDPLPDGSSPPGYHNSLREIHRVLKPGGRIYFDAPIHLHGHEMFITGDLEDIRAQFDPALWKELQLERWRESYEPLERYPTPAADKVWWSQSVVSYDSALLRELRETASVWLLVVTGRRRD